MLPVQLTSLVRYEARFACYRYEEQENTNISLYCKIRVGLVEYKSSLRLGNTSCFGGSHLLAFPTEEARHIVPFQYRFYTKICFCSCSSYVHLLVSTIRGFLEPHWSLELNSMVCKPHL